MCNQVRNAMNKKKVAIQFFVILTFPKTFGLDSLVVYPFIFSECYFYAQNVISSFLNCFFIFQGLPWLNQKWTTPEVIKVNPLDDFVGLEITKCNVRGFQLTFKFIRSNGPKTIGN